jgi:hypothetical protein
VKVVLLDATSDATISDRGSHWWSYHVVRIIIPLSIEAHAAFVDWGTDGAVVLQILCNAKASELGNQCVGVLEQLNAGK